MARFLLCVCAFTAAMATLVATLMTTLVSGKSYESIAMAPQDGASLVCPAGCRLLDGAFVADPSDQLVEAADGHWVAYQSVRSYQPPNGIWYGVKLPLMPAGLSCRNWTLASECSRGLVLKGVGEYELRKCSESNPYLCLCERDVTFPPSPPTTTRPTLPPTSPPPTASKSPTLYPTKSPTQKPTTMGPTRSPTTSRPSRSPTASAPTLSPTHQPSRSPTPPTTGGPSTSPTTSRPSTGPTTSRPTLSPHRFPTKSPTRQYPRAWQLLLYPQYFANALAFGGFSGAVAKCAAQFSQAGARDTVPLIFSGGPFYEIVTPEDLLYNYKRELIDTVDGFAHLSVGGRLEHRTQSWIYPLEFTSYTASPVRFTLNTPAWWPRASNQYPSPNQYPLFVGSTAIQTNSDCNSWQASTYVGVAYVNPVFGYTPDLKPFLITVGDSRNYVSAAIGCGDTAGFIGCLVDVSGLTPLVRNWFQ